jgi:hypothetical protein
MPLPPAEVLELLNREDGVMTQRQDLGWVGAKKRLGRMYLKRKIVVLDDVLFGERQISLPFVVCHELGHWLLHRECNISAMKERELFPEDDEYAEEFSSSVDPAWSSLDFIEWQASTFAAAVLLPFAAACAAILEVQEQLGIAMLKGVIYENVTPEGKALADQQVKAVAERFDVSQMATRIRLKNCKLYHEQAPQLRRPVGDPFAVALRGIR